ncbi:hypothetical protein GQQ23_15800 [Pantoea agglomerans]|uniref:RNase A-like domain-containing protein n=1 Tax=Enterobacter agglomerans TaxID=549 RepID=UPI0013C60D88|nr:RNase A-like domain-containing protein [Pantoea agglomerans]NEG63797.1 hypothetical protein [Pantoea agglomerans]
MVNGFSIAMTPVQLAAIINNETVTGSSVSNRIWGGVGFLGSVLELAGATALCLVPEPTGITKAGCILVGAHSLDGISSSAYQIYTGRHISSLTSIATSGIARELGTDSETADQIGIAIDMMLPFTIAGVARVASVRMGQVSLMRNEAVKGVRSGGHTLKKHVGKSEMDLIDKIGRGLKSGTLKQNSAASSFTSVEIAEKAISKAMKVKRWEIRRWAKSTSSNNLRAFMEFDYVYSSKVGIVVPASSKAEIETNAFTVVLHKKAYNGKPYYVLTAYPRLN